MHNPRARLLHLAAVLFLSALLPEFATAQVLYDNGVPDQGEGYTVSSPWAVADNFTISSPANVGSFQWFVLRAGTGGPSTTMGSYDWQIFSDVGGAPGSILFSGAVAGQTATKTTYTCCMTGYEIYAFDTPIGSIPLSAGTYWLGIRNYASPDGTGWWATSNHLQGDARQSFDNGATFAPINAELAFSVSGPSVVTPEPTSIILVATGLAGIAAAARSRRKSAAK